MNNPKISVVIPVYNGEATIGNCINSILNQEYENIEVICVDDGSVDDSLRVIDSLSRADDRIKLVCNDKNSGTLITRKRGVSAATGDYIAFADSDDWFEKETFALLAREVERDPVDILMYGARALDENGRDIKMGWLIPKAEDLRDQDCLKTGNALTLLWNKLVEASLCKKAYENMQDLFMTVREDNYACVALHYYADSYRTIPNVLYNWVLGGGVSSFDDKRTIQKFEVFCSSCHNYTDAIKAFFKNNHYEEAQKFIKREDDKAVKYCIDHWMNTISEGNAAAGLEILNDHFGKQQVAIEIMKRLGELDKAKKNYKKIKASKSYKLGKALTSIPRKIRQRG